MGNQDDSFCTVLEEIIDGGEAGANAQVAFDLTIFYAYQDGLILDN